MTEAQKKSFEKKREAYFDKIDKKVRKDERYVLKN